MDPAVGECAPQSDIPAAPCGQADPVNCVGSDAYGAFMQNRGISDANVQQGNVNPSLAPPGSANNFWVQATTAEGKVYYYNARTRQSVWERPATGRVLSYEELQLLTKQASQRPNVAPNSAPNEATDQVFNAAARSGQQNLSMPPIAGSFGASNAAVGRPQLSAPTQSTWLQYFSGDGRPYYFNSLTGETSWTNPCHAKNGMPGSDLSVSATSQVDGTDGSVAMATGDGAAGQEESKQPSAGAASLEGPKPVVQVVQKTDPSKPISSNPVAGTAWCVVWTGDYRVFFFNPTTRASVWERPPELYGRPDVDLLISKPPEPKKGVGKREPSPMETSTEEITEAGSEAVAEKVEQEIPSKKKRKRADVERSAEGNGGGDKSAATEKPESVAPPAKPKDGAFEAELKAAQERAQIPLETRTSQFKAMLQEKEVSPFSTWEKELHKIVFDPRYLLLTSKERKEAFEEYVKERADQERAERKRKYNEAKEGFQRLLEEAELSHKSVFSAFVETWNKDSRFKAVEKGRDREALFDEHVRNLRMKKRQEEQTLAAKRKEEFIQLLREQGSVKKRSRWSEIKKTVNQDSRYRQVDSGSREEWFREYCKTLPSENSDDEEEEARKERLKQKERKLREEVAQKAREKEVAAELESQLKERNREMEKHLMLEAEDNFKALLVDLIKTTDQTWKDCKRRLRKDSRWESADLLDRQRKEELFVDHIDRLEAKHKSAFLRLLEEAPGIDLGTSWKEAKKMIRKDPRYIRYAVSERKCEKLFKEVIREKLNQAKANFMELLKETKIITAKSKQQIQEEEEHLKDILSVLENDKRYLKLEAVAREREKLLETYLESLAADEKKAT